MNGVLFRLSGWLCALAWQLAGCSLVLGSKFDDLGSRSDAGARPIESSSNRMPIQSDEHDGGPGDACVQAQEICNGKDDDCDKEVDEAEAVTRDCASKVLNAAFACQTGYCIRVGRDCNKGFFNCDGRPDNGCESKCSCGPDACDAPDTSQAGTGEAGQTAREEQASRAGTGGASAGAGAGGRGGAGAGGSGGSSADCPSGLVCSDGSCARQTWDFETDADAITGLSAWYKGTDTRLAMSLDTARADGNNRRSLKIDFEFVPSPENSLYLFVEMCASGTINLSGKTPKLIYYFEAEPVPSGTVASVEAVTTTLQMAIQSFPGETVLDSNRWLWVQPMYPYERAIPSGNVTGFAVVIALPSAASWNGTVWLDDIDTVEQPLVAP